MNAKDIATALKRMKKVPSTLPDWGLPESITQILVEHPAASADYINDRLDRQFEHREEIGAHLAKYMEVTGMSSGLLSQMNDLLRLQTKPTKAKLSRQENTKRVWQENLAKLDAAVMVIRGAGSPMQVQDVTGINFMVIYKLARKLLARQGVPYGDLPKLTMAERLALAKVAERDYSAQLEKRYQSRV